MELVTRRPLGAHQLANQGTLVPPSACAETLNLPAGQLRSHCACTGNWSARRQWGNTSAPSYHGEMSMNRETGVLMTACTQPGCTGTIVDGYCDVCGSPAGAIPFVPAEAAASAGHNGR